VVGLFWSSLNRRPAGVVRCFLSGAGIMVGISLWSSGCQLLGSKRHASNTACENEESFSYHCRKEKLQ
jgi:hypothetical protein